MASLGPAEPPSSQVAGSGGDGPRRHRWVAPLLAAASVVVVAVGATAVVRGQRRPQAQPPGDHPDADPDDLRAADARADDQPVDRADDERRPGRWHDAVRHRRVALDGAARPERPDARRAGTDGRLVVVVRAADVVHPLGRAGWPTTDGQLLTVQQLMQVARGETVDGITAPLSSWGARLVTDAHHVVGLNVEKR